VSESSFDHIRTSWAFRRHARLKLKVREHPNPLVNSDHKDRWRRSESEYKLQLQELRKFRRAIRPAPLLSDVLALKKKLELPRTPRPALDIGELKHQTLALRTPSSTYRNARESSNIKAHRGHESCANKRKGRSSCPGPGHQGN
jgi:hypothetical protein